MAHPGAFRLNDVVRAKRLTPLPVSALLEANEGLQENLRPNQGGTAYIYAPDQNRFGQGLLFAL